MSRATVSVAEGLSFPESPRWHDGRLFVSDMGTRMVVTFDRGSGSLTTVVPKVPGAPSGLTWDDEGRLLVVSMARQLVYREDGESQLAVWADLSSFGGGWRNDAVRHPNGWLYVGGVDDDVSLVMIDRGGQARVAAAGMAGPNGMVITPDGATLIVNEMGAERLAAFTIGAGGSLTDQRVWASLPGWRPDGCCLDAEGAVWVASAGIPEVRRVVEGGEVVATVTTSQGAYACMLGGTDRRTLFVCTAPGNDDASLAANAGRIEAVEVDVPGAGWP